MSVWWNDVAKASVEDEASPNNELFLLLGFLIIGSLSVSLAVVSYLTGDKLFFLIMCLMFVCVIKICMFVTKAEPPL